jgi:hypothetical protein
MKIGKLLNTQDLVTAPFEDVDVPIQYPLEEEQLTCPDGFLSVVKGPLLDPNRWIPFFGIFRRHEDVALNERSGFITDGSVCMTFLRNE